MVNDASRNVKDKFTHLMKSMYTKQITLNPITTKSIYPFLPWRLGRVFLP